jgi:hypothetical protein
MLGVCLLVPNPHLPMDGMPPGPADPVGGKGVERGVKMGLKMPILCDMGVQHS